MTTFNETDYKFYRERVKTYDTSTLLQDLALSTSCAEYKQAAQEELVARGTSSYYLPKIVDYRALNVQVFDPQKECICETLLWGHLNDCPHYRKI